MGQAVVGAVGIAQCDAQQGIDRAGALSGPVAQGDQPVIALLQDVAQPDAEQGTTTGAVPVAVRRYVGIEQLWNAHIGDDAKQQRQAIDLLSGNG